MWIIAGGMLRSASTLQYQIASDIVERLGLGERVTWHSPEEHEAFFAENKAAGFKVFKSHDLTPSIRMLLQTGRGIGIYIYRDVRDVVSSLMEKEGQDYSGRRIRELVENLLKSHEQWINEDAVYVSRYETVVADLGTEVANIARHIGVEVSSSMLSKIVENYALEQQEKRIAECCSSGRYVTVNDLIKYDSHSLLHLNHLAGGEIGRYKKNLSAEQVKVLEETAGAWLAANGYM